MMNLVDNYVYTAQNVYIMGKDVVFILIHIERHNIATE